MFNGIWLVATEPLLIRGADIAAGESFEISRTQSGALLVQGKATIQHPQPHPPKRTKALTPEPAPRRRGRPRKTPADSERTYARRDLQAEE